MIFCSGNHDLDDRSAEGEKIARWVGDIRNSASPRRRRPPIKHFTVSPVVDGPLVRAVSKPSFATPQPGARSWIWVHHAPPANSPTSWGVKRFLAMSSWCNGSRNTSRRW